MANEDIIVEFLNAEIARDKSAKSKVLGIGITNSTGNASSECAISVYFSKSPPDLQLFSSREVDTTQLCVMAIFNKLGIESASSGPYNQYIQIPGELSTRESVRLFYPQGINALDKNYKILENAAKYRKEEALLVSTTPWTWAAEYKEGANKQGDLKLNLKKPSAPSLY